MQPLIVYDGNVSDSSAAPGRLEQVRTFLNTWRIPNGTRTAVDQLTERTTALASWAKTMPDIPPSGRRELGNVRAACRIFGVHHSTYYRWRGPVLRSGLEMLRPRERRPPRMPNQTSQLTEQRVLAFALGHPGLGPRQISASLAQEMRPR